MDIYIKQGTNTYRFAILPISISIAASNNNTSVNISNLGDINLVGNSGLKAISLESFFPNPSNNYSFVRYTGYSKPSTYVKMFQSFMENPVYLTITGTDIKTTYTIESFTYTEPDATGDVKFMVDLLEYKKPKIKPDNTITINKNTKIVLKKDGKRDSKNVKSTIYVVKPGDTLTSISKKLTGNALNYISIANQNGITNYNNLTIGQKLKINITNTNNKANNITTKPTITTPTVTSVIRRNIRLEIA